MFKLKSLLNEQTPETITTIKNLGKSIDFSNVSFEAGDFHVPPNDPQLKSAASKLIEVFKDPKNENIQIEITLNAGTDKGAIVQKMITDFWNSDKSGWVQKQIPKFKGIKEDPNKSANQSQKSKDYDNRILARARARELYRALRRAIKASVKISKTQLTYKIGKIQVNTPSRYANAQIKVTYLQKTVTTVNKFHCNWLVDPTEGGQALASSGQLKFGDGTISNTGNYCRWWQLEGFSDNIPGDTITVSSNPRTFPDAFLIQMGNERWYSGFAGKAYHKDKKRNSKVAKAVYQPARNNGEFPHKAESDNGRYFAFELYWMITNEDLVGKFNAVMKANGIDYEFTEEKILPDYNNIVSKHKELMQSIKDNKGSGKIDDLKKEWRLLWKGVNLASAGRSKAGHKLSTKQKQVKVNVVIFAPLIGTKYNLEAKCAK
jgi:hypothetical protein